MAQHCCNIESLEVLKCTGWYWDNDAQLLLQLAGQRGWWGDEHQGCRAGEDTEDPWWTIEKHMHPFYLWNVMIGVSDYYNGPSGVMTLNK